MKGPRARGPGRRRSNSSFGARISRSATRRSSIPRPRIPAGEVHEDWGVFSYDKARKTFVLRSFHVEGFVNQYVLESPTADAKTFVFVSESIENIPAGFRARLTYRIIDNDTFEQTFDLAPPGQEFTCYSKGIMKRQKGEPK